MADDIIQRVDMYDGTFDNLTKAMAIAAKRQTIIAQNIANANNPDYVPLKFDEALNKAVEKADKGSVVLEDEMNDLSSVAGQHSAYIKFLTAKLSVIRTVVTQGRR